MALSKDVIAQHGLSESGTPASRSTWAGAEPARLSLQRAVGEHCSYKSSRKHLRGFPTKGPRVLVGPGENAGVVDIGDGMAAAFKMESHNHPSYIEPYQGAATGVGGILRDVFTMGARPIASLNSLRFGDPSHPKTAWLLDGVVRGIGGYGNCIGVPTVGGEVAFDEARAAPPVNAFTVGVLSRTGPSGDGGGRRKSSSYVGSKTGRDLFTARQWPGGFDGDSESSDPRCRWAIRSPRSRRSRPASRSSGPTRWSVSRTWAPRG